MIDVEEELVELKARLTRLEATVQHLSVAELADVVPPLDEPLDATQLCAWLRAQGLTSDLPPEVHAHAERWRQLPEEEKQAHIQEMRSLVLDPPLSQIIIDNRR